MFMYSKLFDHAINSIFTLFFLKTSHQNYCIFREKSVLLTNFFKLADGHV